MPPEPRVVVLVEGESDAVVVRDVAARSGIELAVVAMGGITNVRRHVEQLARELPEVAMLGLCDERERRFMEKVEPALRDIFVCVRDLEDELIRSIGPAEVVGLLDEIGDLGRFRTFQDQPEWRGEPLHDQLRRFAGTRSGRKVALATRLAAELDVGSLPEPLALLVERVRAEVS